MASLESVTIKAGNHGNPPRPPNYAAHVGLDDPRQLDILGVMSLTTLHASTTESVSNDYGIIDDETSTSAAAVHYAANTANNYVDENTPAPDMTRNTPLVVRFVLLRVYCVHFWHLL
jgi:hypothetical protein